MEKELIDAAVNLFKNPEQWNSFLELVRLNEKIETEWYSTLVEKLQKLELNNQWSYYVPKERKGEIYWYLKAFDRESIKVCLEREHFSLKIPDDDKAKKQTVINEINNKYKMIFDNLYSINKDADDVIVRETGFVFENSNGKIDDDHRLAWFAGNATKEYCDQVKSKLKPFFEKELTDALKELNSTYYPPKKS